MTTIATMLAADIFDDYRSVVYIAVAVIYVVAQMGALIKRKPDEKKEKTPQPAPESRAPQPARRAETVGEARGPETPRARTSASPRTAAPPPPVPPSARPVPLPPRHEPTSTPARGPQPTRGTPPVPARRPQAGEPVRRPLPARVPARIAAAQPSRPPGVESASPAPEASAESELRTARAFREARQQDAVAGEISAGLLNFGPRAASEQLRRFQALARSRRAVQQAFVLSELLAPPVALRGPESGAPGL